MESISKKYGVCDLKYAKRIKELGVKQESLWWWVSIRGQEPEIIFEEQLGMLECNSPHIYVRVCSAFTVAELGLALPSVIYNKIQKEYTLAIYKHGKHWNVSYDWDDGYDGGDCLKCFEAYTEANARAKMYIYVLENKLIQV